MDAFLVICQGIGLATAAGVRPFLPALLAGALAGADSGLDFDGTDFAFLEQPVWLIAVVAALAAVVGYERRRPEAFEAGTLGAALAGMSIGVGALLFGASLADEGHPAWAGLVAGIACAALANASARNFFARVGAPARRRRPLGAGRLQGRLLARDRGPGDPRAARLAARARRAWRPPPARPPARRREVRGPALPAMSARARRSGGPSKLVLAVIDGLRPEALERAVADGRAPVARRDHGARHLRRRLRRRLPLRDAGVHLVDRHRRRAPTSTGSPRMNWFHRDEGRYVEYGSSFQASRRVGIHASLTDTIYNLNLAHLSRATPTVFELLDDAGRAHGRDDLPHLPRPPPPRARPARARSRAWPARRCSATPSGGRASSSTPTCSPPARPAAGRSSASRARATRTRAASGRTWSSTTSSTSSCSRCPTTTPTRTGSAPTRRSTPPRRPTARSRGSWTPPAGATPSSTTTR